MYMIRTQSTGGRRCIMFVSNFILFILSLSHLRIAYRISYLTQFFCVLFRFVFFCCSLYAVWQIAFDTKICLHLLCAYVCV